ncbi:unnamed protein product [Miscanthus lutarioriparius]|uniref:AP2/ERF domain-containing protein n=1 Tax=Miscanthus lutarioriparius TaxID=422564 RepID=A0A811R3U1_9POAL|nr:unnamed protein product [Miscanthus lutarioriparius]
MTTSSNRTARRGPARRVPAPAPAGRPQKPSEYTGVRLRQWGRWAAEVRVPGTRQKLWIGTFETDRQAALAYDAAVFCFYGVHLPRRRRFNYPGAPRPNIPAWVRVQLNVASVKAIAQRHARAVDARLPPLMVAATASAAADGRSSAGEGASALLDDNTDGMDGENLVTRAVDETNLCSIIDAEEVTGESTDVRSTDSWQAL